MNTSQAQAAPPPPPAANPYFQNAGYSQTAATGSASPIAAAVLGMIPGVGAIFNGQYLKGLVHAAIFGLIITLMVNAAGSAEPMLGFLLTTYFFYMIFEAYHTAKKRQAGLPVEEWSSLMNPNPNRVGARAPLGPIVLIILGVLFLMDTLHVIEFRELARFWPVLLIVAGAVMLYNRLGGYSSSRAQAHRVAMGMEPRDEQ